jgi:hypothetical protein
MRSSDDFVPWLHFKRGHRKIKRLGAVGAGNAVLDFDSGGKFPLERIDV